MEEGLTGRVALVTGAGGGAAGGIGAGIARVLSRYGATVAVNDVSADAADTTVAELRAAGRTAKAFVADISFADQATWLCDAAGAEFGRLDVLVNNAGITGRTTIENTSDEQWTTLIGVNLSGAFYTTRAALKYLRRSDAGRVVFISSIAGIRIATVGNAAYTASKAGMLGLMRHLAAEVADAGITANAILPGGVVTPLVARHTADVDESQLFAEVPLGRGATTTEIGEAVAFLASPRAAYITGAEIVVDGGRSILPGSATTRAHAQEPTSG